MYSSNIFKYLIIPTHLLETKKIEAPKETTLNKQVEKSRGEMKEKEVEEEESSSDDDSEDDEDDSDSDSEEESDEDGRTQAEKIRDKVMQRLKVMFMKKETQYHQYKCCEIMKMASALNFEGSCWITIHISSVTQSHSFDVKVAYIWLFRVNHGVFELESFDVELLQAHLCTLMLFFTLIS